MISSNKIGCCIVQQASKGVYSSDDESCVVVWSNEGTFSFLSKKPL